LHTLLTCSDNVDGFIRQLEQAMIDVLDVLAPLNKCTKRRGKADSQFLSDAALSAKQNRRQLERRWKRSEADRVEYGLNKLKTITVNISTRLQSIAVYHLSPTSRNLPLQMDTLAEVTVEEVSRLIGDRKSVV